MHNCGYNAIKFDSTINTIDQAAFSNCAILRDSSIQSQITFVRNDLTIGISAFETCAGIVKINLAPNTIFSSSGSEAFAGCANLTGFGGNAKSAQIDSIGAVAFADCASLTMEGIHFDKVSDEI
jgi:hypothetical protein